MNIVLDDAVEISVKKETRTHLGMALFYSLGRIMLKGDNITLIMGTDESNRSMQE